MVEYEQHGRVAVLRINRPEARNAVNGDVAAGMEAAIDRLEDDVDTWVGVITHEGSVFSAGAERSGSTSARAMNAPSAAIAAIATTVSVTSCSSGEATCAALRPR